MVDILAAPVILTNYIMLYYSTIFNRKGANTVKKILKACRIDINTVSVFSRRNHSLGPLCFIKG